MMLLFILILMNELTINIAIPSDNAKVKMMLVSSIQDHNETIRKFNKLSEEIAWLKRNLFGKKSERNYVDGNQQILDGLIDVVEEDDGQIHQIFIHKRLQR